MHRQTDLLPAGMPRPRTPGQGRRMLAVLAVLAALLPCRTWAQSAGMCTGAGAAEFQPRTIAYIGSQDGVAPGQPIATDSQWDFNSYLSLFSNTSGYCSIRSVVGYILPTVASVPGLVYSEAGRNYQVFKTNVDGVGFILAIDNGDGIWRDITTTTPVGLRDFPTAQTAFGLSLRFKFVAYARLRPGLHIINAQNIYQIMVFDAPWQGGGATLKGTRPLFMRSSSINITARGCQVIPPTTQTVSLPPVARAGFTGVGATPGGSSLPFSFNLACDPDVRVKAVMTDVNDAANTSDRLTLAASSTAAGVGVQIFKEGESTALRFGPDSSAAGAPNQWHVGDTLGSPSGTTLVTASLRAGYVQTAATVTPGEVKASATITFSYQ